jgi:uncharacterized membrane protein YphA (DoxX/SURF4 family)
LCSAYLWSGVTKLINFKSTAAGFESRLHIPVPKCALAVTVTVQIVGSVMIVTGWMAWLAAIALATHTMVATAIVYPFWNKEGLEKARNFGTWLEHAGLSAAFLLLAWPYFR